MGRVQYFFHRVQSEFIVIALGGATLFVVFALWITGPGSGLINSIDLAFQGGVNRRAPDVTAPLPGLHFSSHPTDSEFLHAALLQEPLVPVGRTTRTENEALAKALTAYENIMQFTGERDNVQPILSFLKKYPESPWRPGLLINLGIIYRETGHFSLAMETFKSAWALSKDFTDPNGRAIGDMAVAQLSQYQAYLGRKEELGPLLAEIKTRNIRGTSAELVSFSSRGYAHMQQWPQLSFRCGPLALLRILLHQTAQPDPRAVKALYNAHSTPNGLSLPMVQRMSVTAGMNYQMAYRTPGAKIIMPAVAHWKMGHYAAIVGEENGRYLIQDSTFGSDLRLSTQTLDTEASGYFLVPAGPLPQGWRSVSVAEGNKIWGRGDTGGNRDAQASGPDSTPAAFPSSGTGDDAGNPNGVSDSADKNNDCGCTTWNVEPMTVSLSLHDRPLGYKPPIGPAIDLNVYYSHRDVEQPGIFNYVNIGPKWTFTWLSYVTDTIGTNFTAQLYQRGGGVEPYTMPSMSAKTSKAGPYSQAVLTRTTDSQGYSTGFKRLLKDGSSQTFGVAYGNKFFMTEFADPQGNKVTITYDSQMRIAAITDAIGQVTTLSYENTDPLKITKVTDPFGRSARFGYNSAGQLISITDTIGITSSFTYGAGDFVDSLTTPYGTTRFNFADSTNNASLGDARWIYITDPFGEESAVEFNQYEAAYSSDSVAPNGMNTENLYLQYRNTYIWNPAQTRAARNPSGSLNATMARIIHWAHTPDGNSTSRNIESIKNPLERRVWFDYPDQTEANFSGSANTPLHIGRVLDDGATQLKTFKYNDYGKVTQLTDPQGRIITYNYASNDVDLTSIVNTSAGKTLATITYNSQHLPVKIKLANGQTIAYEYNVVGQLTKFTDAFGQSTTYSYDANHYLASVQGPLAAATYTFTHDIVGRISSATDPVGGTISYAYDDADRPTKVSFPDGTSSRFTYNLLDLATITDRLGQQTQLTHDANRQLIKVIDPLNQITQYAYTPSGFLSVIRDPNGHDTGWLYDNEDRVTQKTYADGTTQSLAYEPSTSRLASATDALGQVTAYAYNIDNSLSSVTYTNAPKVSFTYDAQYTRPTSMTDGTGTSTYIYYPVGSLGANRLKTVTTPVAGTTSFDSITYSYDELDRVVSRNIGGAVETTTYDALGRVQAVANGLDTFNYGYTDATARVSSIRSTHGPALDLAYYGPAGDELLQRMTYSIGGTVISQFGYEFNANDDVTRFTQIYLGQRLAALDGASTGGASGLTGNGGSSQWALAAMQGPTLMARVQAIGWPLILSMGMALIALIASFAFTLSRRWRVAFVIPAIFAMTFVSACGGGGSSGGGTSGGSGGGGGSSSSSSSSSASSSSSSASSSSSSSNSSSGGGTPTAQVTSYYYDKASRLRTAFVGTDISTPGSPQYVYDYDAASNITGMTVNGASKALSYTATNALTSGTYDANGSPLALDTGNYEWDGANRLVKYTNGLKESDFTYDGLSRLVRIVDKVAGIVTADHAYTWCGMTRCLERDNSKTNAPASKQYFDQGEIQGTLALYYVVDRLGSVRQLVDGSAVIQAQYEYDPYGNRTKVGGLLDSDYGFAGLFHHNDSSLDLAVYRAYDAVHARWLNRDPIGELGGLNLYVYAKATPLNLIDPSGFAPLPSPNFLPPTNTPQTPPASLPDGYYHRSMPPTEQYPNGYWKQYNQWGQPVDPSTGKPPSNVSRAEARARTHVPYPEGQCPMNERPSFALQPQHTVSSESNFQMSSFGLFPKYISAFISVALYSSEAY
ncbi:MAG: RHS repeat-associated core domain-containing protein [Asticcacaulis sp.]|uniref:RHS repeat protein n=1 Tax=Asticcacaulis sp. TaxID=1872648 RepID=UPI0039E6A8B6